MKLPTLRQWEAAIPLLSLIVLIGLFFFPVTKYVECKRLTSDALCESTYCDSIPCNLEKALLLARNDKSKEGLPAETDEKKKREAEHTRDVKSHEERALVYSGRVNFLFFMMIYLSISAVALGVGCFVIYKSFVHTSKYAFSLVVVALGLGGGFFTLLYFRWQSHMRVLNPLIKITVFQDLEHVWQIVRVSNSFGFAVVLLLTLGSCAALYPRNTKSFPDGLKQIAQQMQYLRLILYIGTAMLVVGMLFVRSVYQWSQAYLVREDQVIKIADTLLSSLLAAQGGYFTLLLAVVYLPAAYILRRRADSVEQLPELETEKEAVLQQFNVAFSLTQSLPRVVAILGPLLVGPVGELFSRVG